MKENGVNFEDLGEIKSGNHRDFLDLFIGKYHCIYCVDMFFCDFTDLEKHIHYLCHNLPISRLCHFLSYFRNCLFNREYSCYKQVIK